MDCSIDFGRITICWQRRLTVRSRKKLFCAFRSYFAFSNSAEALFSLFEVRAFVLSCLDLNITNNIPVLAFEIRLSFLDIGIKKRKSVFRTTQATFFGQNGREIPPVLARSFVNTYGSQTNSMRFISTMFSADAHFHFSDTTVEREFSHMCKDNWVGCINMGCLFSLYSHTVYSCFALCLCLSNLSIDYKHSILTVSSMISRSK